jgi:hypothetical protein
MFCLTIFSRMTLEDGTLSTAEAMLSTQMMSKVKDGSVRKESIIKVNDYTVATVGGRK